MRLPWSKAEPQITDDEWLMEFLPLYEQAMPIMNRIVATRSDGTPTLTFEDGREGGWILPYIMAGIKRLPTPRNKEFQKGYKDFAAALGCCIKACEWQLKFLGAERGTRFANMVSYITAANSLMKKPHQVFSPLLVEWCDSLREVRTARIEDQTLRFDIDS